MTKLKLGNTPKDFSKAVPIPMLDGSFEDINVKFIYRTKKEFAQMLDENQVQAKALDAEKTDQDAERTVSDWYQQSDKFNAASVMRIASGWDLDDPFSEDSLLQLENEHPGALLSIAAVYRSAVAEARIKN